eukprot:4258093-Amphidinium_carterae.3
MDSLVFSPTERRIEALNMIGRNVGSVSVNNTFEAVLRSDLLEKVPKTIVEKVYADGRLSSVDILEELMKSVLPAFHTVRVTLLDSIESAANKCSSFLQLQSSLRQWTRGIRISMTRYGLTPEPRRLWLGLLSRIGNLQSEPMFAVVMDRHMVQTGVRTVQTLESVLSFTVSIEAEVDAIIQDQGNSNQEGRKNNARGNAASASDSSSSTQKPQPNASSAGTTQNPKSSGGASGAGSSKLDLCKLWGTQEGCRFGKSCRCRHPNAKISDNLCFICGAKSHKSRECKLRTAGADKPGGGGGNTSQRGAPAGGKSAGKGGGRGDQASGQARSSSGGKPRQDNHSKPRSSSQTRDGSARGASAQAGKDAGKPQRNSSRDRGLSGSGSRRQTSGDGKAGGKNKASNPARALSAAVDGTTSTEGLLDSGASHVIAPLEELGDQERQGSQKVSLTLASGKPTESVIKEGEVYAHRVRRVLIPLGKLIRQTGVLTVWARSGLHLLAADEAGQLRLVYKPVLRQGGMPHVSTQAVAGFRNALKDTRNNPSTLTFEQWGNYLGSHIPVCDVQYCVTENGVTVHGIPSQEVSEESAEGLGSRVADISAAATVLHKLTESAERLNASLLSCSELLDKRSEIVPQTCSEE